MVKQDLLGVLQRSFGGVIINCCYVSTANDSGLKQLNRKWKFSLFNSWVMTIAEVVFSKIQLLSLFLGSHKHF